MEDLIIPLSIFQSEKEEKKNKTRVVVMNTMNKS